MERRYRVGEFAKASGVSVRTLHHYDALGLVKPAGRDDSGFRYYTDGELLRLQQVLTLRYLGFTLGRIKDLMRAEGFDIEASLRAQHTVLRERQQEIAGVTAALDRMLGGFQTTGEWDWRLVAEASQVLARKEKTMDQAQMMKRFEELGAQLGPGEREAVEREWAVLIADVEANLTLEPADPRAIALADRWTALREKTEASYTSRGFGDLWQAIGEARREGTLPESPHGPSQAVGEFIARVIAAQDGA